MAKKRNFTPIGAIEQSLQNQTKQLYEQTPSAIPAAPIPGVGEGASAKPVVPERKKKLQSIIPRANAKCIYFEDEHNEAVERIHWLCKSDRQDIIRTALEHFLTLYYKDGELAEEGRELIQKYFDKTHVLI